MSHLPFARLAGALVPLLLALSGCGDHGRAAAPAASTTVVGVVALQPETLNLTAELPGRTTAPLSAEIRPQIDGIVRQRLFAEGQMVKAGQALYKIDPATYQAAYASAQAAVAKAEATVEADRLTAVRRAELAKIDAMSQQDTQDASVALKQAQADLNTARAALETARINLARTEIRSPIGGRIDLSTVTPGALVTAAQATALTTVRQIDPMQVDITQSSADLLRLQRDFAQGRLKKAGSNEAGVTLLLEDGSTYPRSGRLRFSGVAVNTNTGAVTLRALFDNPDGLLLPGMYVRAVLQTAVAPDALLVPQQAVAHSANGSTSVLVVDAQHKVQVRQVTVGRVVDSRWLVTDGLKAGEEVIVEGSQKVKLGDSVQVQVVSQGPAPTGGSAPIGGSAAAPAAAR